jgi:hypothetical protein
MFLPSFQFFFVTVWGLVITLTSVSITVVKVGQYKNSKKLALEALALAPDDQVNQVIIRFLMLCSSLLDDETESSEEFSSFAGYVPNLPKGIGISEDDWTFKGLSDAVYKSKAKLETKFLLMTIMDMLCGDVARENLSFFRPPPRMA